MKINQVEQLVGITKGNIRAILTTATGTTATPMWRG